MIEERTAAIVYDGDGVAVYVDYKSPSQRCVYNNKFKQVIPSHISMYLDYQKILIIEKDD